MQIWKTAGAIIGGAYFGTSYRRYQTRPISGHRQMWIYMGIFVDALHHFASAIIAAWSSPTGMATELAAVPEQVEINVFMAGLFELSLPAGCRPDRSGWKFNARSRVAHVAGLIFAVLRLPC